MATATVRVRDDAIGRASIPQSRRQLTELPRVYLAPRPKPPAFIQDSKKPVILSGRSGGRCRCQLAAPAGFPKIDLNSQGTVGGWLRSTCMFALPRPRKLVRNALRRVRHAPQPPRGSAPVDRIETCRRACRRVAWEHASPEDCRRQARRFEALAGATQNDLCREAYLRVALCWRTAATQLECRRS